MLRQLRFAGGKTKAPRGTDLHRVLPRSWAGAQVSTRSVGFGGPSCSLSVVCGGRSASAFVQPRPWAPGCSPAWIGRVSPWPSERSWRGRASVATGPRPLGGFLEAGSSLGAEDVEEVDGGSPCDAQSSSDFRRPASAVQPQRLLPKESSQRCPESGEYVTQLC